MPPAEELRNWPGGKVLYPVPRASYMKGGIQGRASLLAEAAGLKQLLDEGRLLLLQLCDPLTLIWSLLVGWGGQGLARAPPSLPAPGTASASSPHPTRTASTPTLSPRPLPHSASSPCRTRTPRWQHLTASHLQPPHPAPSPQQHPPAPAPPPPT